MKEQMNARIIVGIFMILLSLFGLIAEAQELEPTAEKKDCLGFTVSFGTRFNEVVSNHSAINNMNLMEEGGSLGIVWGKKSIETIAVLGYYYSAARVPQTIDLIELEVSSHIYPLRAFLNKTSKVEPYTVLGIARNYYKLYGYYTGDVSRPINYSQSTEPYLGKLDVYNASVGVGVSVTLFDEWDFVKLFADTKYSTPFTLNSSTDFSETSVSSQLSFNLGVSFGANHFKNK